jgi:hypothetical protein
LNLPCGWPASGPGSVFSARSYRKAPRLPPHGQGLLRCSWALPRRGSAARLRTGSGLPVPQRSVGPHHNAWRMMAWIVPGIAVARVSPQISLAAGAGLGVGPDLGCAGAGTSSRSVERPATGACNAPVASLTTDESGLHPWPSANLSCPNPVAPAEVLATTSDARAGLAALNSGCTAFCRPPSDQAIHNGQVGIDRIAVAAGLAVVPVAADPIKVLAQGCRNLVRVST